MLDQVKNSAYERRGAVQGRQLQHSDDHPGADLAPGGDAEPAWQRHKNQAAFSEYTGELDQMFVSAAELLTQDISSAMNKSAALVGEMM